MHNVIINWDPAFLFSLQYIIITLCSTLIIEDAHLPVVYILITLLMTDYFGKLPMKGMNTYKMIF